MYASLCIPERMLGEEMVIRLCVFVNIYTYTYIKVKDTPWNAYAHTEVRRGHSSNPNRSRHWQVDGQQSALADLSPGNDNTHCAGG